MDLRGKEIVDAVQTTFKCSKGVATYIRKDLVDEYEWRCPHCGEKLN